MTLSKLSNQDLIFSADQLAADFRHKTLVLLEHLIEIEQRSLHLSLGYCSMFSYCRERLKFSEAGSIRRIASARCLLKFPRIADLLKSGETNLTIISLISKVINTDNHQEILTNIIGKSKREVEIMLVKTYGQDSSLKTKDRIRVLTVTNLALTKSTSTGEGADQLLSSTSPAPLAPQVLDLALSNSGNLPEPQDFNEPNPREHKASKDNYSEDPKVEFKFVAATKLLSLVEDAKNLLSNKYPRGASLEAVFTEAVTVFLNENSPEIRQAKRLARKSAEAITTKNNQKEEDKEKDVENKEVVMEVTTTSSHSRYIPAALRDQVFIRDQGQCSYLAPNGKRCTSRHNLEVDHILPFAKGGSSTKLDNLRLLCRNHNNFEALREFASVEEVQSMITDTKSININIATGKEFENLMATTGEAPQLQTKSGYI